MYLIKLCCGEKVEKPRKFADEKTRLLYEKQKEYEKKIQEMKKNKGGSENSLVKIFLLICYAFPNFSFENLFEMTMSQVNFLQTYAGNVCAYQLESAAYANGNLKKAPAFFLDEKK